MSDGAGRGDATVGAERRPWLRLAYIVAALLVALAAATGAVGGWLLGAAVLGIGAGSILLAGAGPERARPLRPASDDGRLAGAEALLADIPDPVILVDRGTLVVQANAAARALFPGLRTGEPLSFALRAPDVLDGIDEAFGTGRLVRVEHAERVPAERAFEVRIGVLRPPEAGEAGATGAMLFFRDLTSARLFEHMRVDFVANASHELRTPLASLLGFIETLQGPARNDPAARERFLAIMREQARRMTRLIDDLLSLSRIELHAHVPPATATDLRPIVGHMIDTLGPLARESGVAIELNADEGPLTLLGDRDELLRVVENLIENAVKYGGSGGRIAVGARRLPAAEGRPGQIELTVRDHGPGIAPEHLPRLTERFYRVDVAESRLRGGTGLGLAIVKHIVTRHRGRLSIESEPGQGALFRVVFPEHAGP